LGDVVAVGLVIVEPLVVVVVFGGDTGSLVYSASERANGYGSPAVEPVAVRVPELFWITFYIRS
jgi:hypothetical protein